MDNELLNINQVAKLLKVSKSILRYWDNIGKLKSVKTPGGHRRYLKQQIEDFMGIVSNKTDKIENIVCIYGRVSSNEQKQKGDLDRQCQRLYEYCIKKKYKVEHILKDVGSGLSDTRTNLLKLFELVINRKINKVIIEHKDRLTRFQYNVYIKFFGSYNVEIECLDNKANDEEDLVNDIMMLMASFSGKLYGRRSAERRKKKIENNQIK